MYGYIIIDRWTSKNKIVDVFIFKSKKITQLLNNTQQNRLINEWDRKKLAKRAFHDLWGHNQFHEEKNYS